MLGSLRPIRLTTVFLSAALVLGACGGSGESAATSSGESIKVGLITKTETNPFFVKMKEGAQKAAEAQGVELMTAAGRFDGDNASQVTAIENMIAAGVKGILITASDTKAIVPVLKRARDKGILAIALDTPTEPRDGVDALFATDNFKAGELIGKYAAAAFQGKEAKIATLDLNPGVTVGVLRHNGFLAGFGVPGIDPNATRQATDPRVVCSQDTAGDQAKAQTAMENCLQKDPGINLVYTINEPAALGAYTALKAAGREKDVMIVSVDGGCTGVRAVQDGQIAATAQQYPLKMAEQGVTAVAEFARGGAKPSGYTDTGVTLIAAQPVEGVESQDVRFGLDNCWG